MFGKIFLVVWFWLKCWGENGVQICYDSCILSYVYVYTNVYIYVYICMLVSVTYCCIYRSMSIYSICISKILLHNKGLLKN